MANLFWVDGAFPGRLAVCERPGAGGWLDDHLRRFRVDGVDILVSALTPWEQETLSLHGYADSARTAGLEYVSLPMPNLGTPQDGDLATLHRLAAEVRAGRSIAAHCHASVGRSPLIIASVLVLLGIEPDDAWSRIAAVRGRDVPDTMEQRRWPTRLAATITADPGEAAS